jgi:RNA polymerase sigma-70 factor (ECF subfamily)
VDSHPSSSALPDDEALIDRYQSAPESSAGRAALSEIFARYERRIAAWCLRVLSGRDDAADCTQEVLLKLFERLDGFRGDSKFSTWVYTITRNLCLNWIRDHRRPPETSLDADEALDVADSRIAHVSERLENEEDRAALRQIMDEALTPEESQVMYLHYGYGLTLEAISDRLQLTNLSGAKAFIVSAKRKLKSKVELFLSVPRSGQSEVTEGALKRVEGAPQPRKRRDET